MATESPSSVIRSAAEIGLELYEAMWATGDPNPENEPQSLEIRFNVKQAAALVGRSEGYIRREELAGNLPSPPRRPSGQRSGYTLEDLNRMRTHFGTQPWRSEEEDPVILAIQNFKGGVGKSTLSVHLAQYLALQGYRVLFVDADPQASATTMFGIHPIEDVEPKDTLLPFLAGDEPSLAGNIAETRWDGLHLIPSTIGLYDVEYLIASSGDPASSFERLRRGLDGISGSYDVIVIDPPPALGMISLNVVKAINALLVPTPPSSIDFGSTVQFLSMLAEVRGSLEKRGFDREMKFFSLVATKVAENKSAQVAMSDAMREMYGAQILSVALLDSAEFDNANLVMRTVYEFSGKATTTYRRCRRNIDDVCAKIENLITATWNSHQTEARRAGRL